MLVLHGPAGGGKSTLARQLADFLGEDRRRPMRRLAIGRRPARPIHLMLRTLLAVGVAHDRLRTALLAEGEDWTGQVGAACREGLRADAPAVVVLEDVPPGTRGQYLVRAVAEMLEYTECVLIATTGTDTAPAAGDPDVLWHRVAPEPGEARAPGFEERRALLPGPEAALLDIFALWERTEFPLDTWLPVKGLTASERRDMIERLHRKGFLRKVRPGWYELRPVVRDELVGTAPDPEVRGVSALFDARLAQRLLDEPRVLGDTAEHWVELALRLLRSDQPHAPLFLNWLASGLAGEGALIPLLMLKAGLEHHTGGWDALTVPLAAAARQAGLPVAAAEALTAAARRTPGAAVAGRTRPEAAVLGELALTQHHLGRLREAEDTLDRLPAGVPDGWALHVRAAIRTDRGRLREVGRLLRLAIETHQVHGDRRGEAWAVFHYGRLRLTRGDLEEARKRLDTAWHTFQDVGDVVGAAWAATELCRVALLHNGPEPDVLRELEAAPAAHREHGDARGEAWATLWSGVAYADAGDPRAEAVLERALRLFLLLPDRLGAAWAWHHRAALAGATATLRDALSAFTDADCVPGVAWTLLQAPVQAGSLRPPADTLLSEAGDRFEAIGDLAGELWVAAVRHWSDAGASARAVQALGRCYPGHVLADVDWRGPRDGIPHAVRHLILGAGTYPFHEEAPQPAAHIRLTLLDDAPVPDTAARIALRVEPAPGTDAPLPRLTARATPLTRADIDPPHSVPVHDTALFLLTPHAPGRHRVRFTIEDAVSLTVLQQVETDIDVTGPTGVARLAAPQAEPARRA
ncbi:hypothetical protein AQJ84_34485 [Streptomyces resistomycificus]|uniref:AAA+ ATPase domain-containing protein n=1 Tax=Streptomyces resistomycificus TaxID=67356 RepID=A0A0L8L3V0_9ACTN|nr:hypothetical protein ADK37_26015 [Streptomyces resistomycificus]KUN92130.1 hypothetical protein AQJ84_34485 [Streptomyces resistomycificus]